MSPTLLARLRRIERATRRLATAPNLPRYPHDARYPRDYRRPVEMVAWRWVRSAD